MDGRFIIDVKKERAMYYEDKGDYDKAREIATSETYSPIHKALEYHPEEEGSSEKVNDAFADILNDIYSLDTAMFLAGEKYDMLIENTEKRIEAAEKKIKDSEERIKDLNMLCSPDTDFFDVISIQEDLIESGDFNDGIIKASGTTRDTLLEVQGTTGNGQKGNAYVFSDNRYLEDVMPTDDVESIQRKDRTYFEYQKLNAKTLIAPSPVEISYDEQEAYLSILAEFSQPTSYIEIDVKSPCLLKNVLCSSDGRSYIEVLDEPVVISDEDVRFDYAEGVESLVAKGVIPIPVSSYVELIFESIGYTSDALAFEYTPTF